MKSKKDTKSEVKTPVETMSSSRVTVKEKTTDAKGVK